MPMHLDTVTIDPDRRSARVGAGACWRDVVGPAAAHGLTALHGSSPDAPVVASSLAGGLSWQARLHGLQCNAVTAVELILPGGALVRTDAAHLPDLFWALRGGGDFGVVTAIEFDLFPVREVYAGTLAWDIAAAPAVIAAWGAWAAGAPDAATTSLRTRDTASGRRMIAIDGCIVAGTAEAEGLMAPLRALEPELDAFGPLPASALLRLRDGRRAPVSAAVLDTLDERAVVRLIETSGTELRHLGGALAAPAPGAGALSHIDGAFLMMSA